MELLIGTKINFMGVRRVAFGISLAMIGISIISIIAHGGVRLGVDFSGGILLQVQSEKPLPAQDIRSTLEKMGLGDAEIQQFGHESESIIRIAQSKATPELAASIVRALNADYPNNPTELRRQELVGPKVGAELRRTATLAILFALIGMLIYIWFRFEFMFGLGGVAALAHDVIITLGFLSLTNKEITLQIIAALLTIVGYSINDTIVVYDRIRENRKKMYGKSLVDIVNKSVNETLSRTLVTGMSTIFVLIVLFFFGGEVIHDFAFALLVGVLVGTYSSIYIATPLVVDWQLSVDARRRSRVKTAAGRA
jgi:preprotein translocase subunit SecF